jgi:hypothetical protein
MNLFKYNIALKYGPKHQENIKSNHAQLNFIFVSHGKLLMFKSLKCKMFKGLSYVVQLHKVMEHMKGKLFDLKKRNE